MARKEEEHQGEPRRIRLPGFVLDHDIGLGDVIKKGTSYLGIKPCRGCEARGARLNRRVVFTRTQTSDSPGGTTWKRT
jgi:hypothetical protein